MPKQQNTPISSEKLIKLIEDGIEFKRKENKAIEETFPNENPTGRDFAYRTGFYGGYQEACEAMINTIKSGSCDLKEKTDGK